MLILVIRLTTFEIKTHVAMNETTNNTPKRKKMRIRYVVLFALLIYVWLTLLIPSLGSFYSVWVYPYIAIILSSFSRLFPFSVNDLLIIAGIFGLIFYPIYSRCKKNKRPWKKILSQIGVFILFGYVWFYLAWGLNYAQPSFYDRTEICKVKTCDREVFSDFLVAYFTGLNNSYTPIQKRNTNKIHKELFKQFYSLNPEAYGIHNLSILPPKHKNITFSGLFTKMGISGYMGPFFCEYHINKNIPNTQYASTYAHELSHYLGITSEAEANFYSYVTCTNSTVNEIRFSGYLSILNYVLNDACEIYTKEEFEAILSGIRPEVKEIVKQNQQFWKDNYNPTLGKTQHKLYNAYLKGNKIESGTRNYSEVMGLLISHQQWKKEQDELYLIQEGLK